MKIKLFFVTIFALALFSVSTNAQNQTTPQTKISPDAGQTEKKKRPPIFRASKDQIMQAQKMMKDKNHYAGEQTGKLDDATREALKKYQTAESIKATGTLNRETLEKMGIPLTDKQKTMQLPAQTK